MDDADDDLDELIEGAKLRRFCSFRTSTYSSPYTFVFFSGWWENLCFLVPPTR